MIDALSEVAGIRHQKGQREIAIPDKLRDGYSQWQNSAEYVNKYNAYLAKQRAKR